MREKDERAERAKPGMKRERAREQARERGEGGRRYIYTGDPVIHSLYHHFAMYLRAFPASFNTAHS